ncbi:MULTISPECIES: serine hydrolase [unclassified Mucilaginibacter]|uniref:serine hydrolase n=1 Tax=unclassified Mucilaginibacter TaxID=2617802 RepID=UPI002AC984C9|nr:MULTISPECIES: serine hydrolase [unclassified Mucilaginibacter]MEB0261023.1 serine hydrolase [Mucilaginibacter sp. 10I4]MEB0278695.1 serine hydrolase [Mucilaginibacter sp. 10B2]MEB0299405.1 serine hydrolase [Mucilaginibacter sp. 5C4]WPX23353.1 serine hydrolase [Mucilaginibacter sp. 5C4]
MKKTGCVLLLLLLAACLNVSAQASATDTLQKKIRAVESNLSGLIQTEGQAPWTLKERMAHYKVNGVTIAVIRNYKMEWAKGYGLADAAAKIPVTNSTLFQAASISKSLNGVGILKLVQDGKLDPDKDINQYLTTWKFPYDTVAKGKTINTKNLLSHTAGITVHGFEGYTNKDSVPTIVQVLNGTKPANSDPIRSMFVSGLRSEYSGGGITVSQLMLMDITRQPYDKFMYQNVLKPLGMTSSTYAQPPVNTKPDLLATGYRGDGSTMKSKYNIYPEQAAAGLWTNPTDLSKYIIETQLALQGKSAKVLNQANTKLRLTPYMDKSAALGVFINDFDGTKYFEHGGANEGYRCQYFGSLDGGNGVVVMVNSDDGAIINEIINSVAKIYNFKGLYHSIVYKEVAVDSTVLQSYVGKYEMNPGRILAISREGNKLFGQATGQGKLDLFAEAQNKFFLKTVPVEIEFIKNDKRQVITCRIYQGGAHDAKKIE